jgi:hypothetical protein
MTLAILLALTLIDANHHPRAVNIRQGEANCFRDAQAGRVAGGQDGAMFDATDGSPETGALLPGLKRQSLRFLPLRDDVGEGPVPLERDLVDKT